MRLDARYIRDLLILAALVVLAALLLTFAFYGSVQSSREILGSYALISSGPVGGWFLAAQDHSLVGALWSLLPLALFTLGPLVMALRYPMRRIRWLSVAGIFWLLAGVFYGVAIWI
jgi:hypothetical protein